MDEDPRLGGGGGGGGVGGRPALPAREPIIHRSPLLPPVHRPPPTPPRRPRDNNNHLSIITPRTVNNNIHARPPPPTSMSSTTTTLPQRNTLVQPREIIGLQDWSNGPRQLNEYVDSPHRVVKGGQTKNNVTGSYRDREVVSLLIPPSSNHNHQTNHLDRNNSQLTSRGLNNINNTGTNNNTGIISTQPKPSTGSLLKGFSPTTNNAKKDSLHLQHHRQHNPQQITHPPHLQRPTSPPSPQTISSSKGQQNDSNPLMRGNRTEIDEPHQDSIICNKCGRCKCSACTGPRELPSRWLCDDKCNCSPESVVDYASCLCCVQFIFYHGSCSGDDSSGPASDRPCACCEVAHCCKRWTCMALMSLCLPCLCLYWPLKGLVGLSKLCYNGCSRRGCHCHTHHHLHRGEGGSLTSSGHHNNSQGGTKRPLIDSESSQSSSA